MNILLVSLIFSSFVVHGVISKDDPPPPPPPGAGFDEFQQMFAKFFDPQSNFIGSGSKQFEEFIRESTKKIGMPAAEEDNKDGNKDGNSTAAKKEEIPLAGKVFAFYGKTYGCAKSKVYQEFLKKYDDKRLPKIPTPDEAYDNSWLAKMAERGVEPDGSASISPPDAEKKMNKLDKPQRQVLKDGEDKMPPEAQAFLAFVKSAGCQDEKLSDYTKFNERLNEEYQKIEKKGKKMPVSYYVAKAVSIAGEEF